jgi:hypothetical protein
VQLTVRLSPATTRSALQTRRPSRSAVPSYVFGATVTVAVRLAALIRRRRRRGRRTIRSSPPPRPSAPARSPSTGFPLPALRALRRRPFGSARCSATSSPLTTPLGVAASSTVRALQASRHTAFGGHRHRPPSGRPRRSRVRPRSSPPSPAQRVVPGPPRRSSVQPAHRHRLPAPRAGRSAERAVPPVHSPPRSSRRPTPPPACSSRSSSRSPGRPYVFAPTVTVGRLARRLTVRAVRRRPSAPAGSCSPPPGTVEPSHRSPITGFPFPALDALEGAARPARACAPVAADGRRSACSSSPVPASSSRHYGFGATVNRRRQGGLAAVVIRAGPVTAGRPPACRFPARRALERRTRSPSTGFPLPATSALGGKARRLAARAVHVASPLEPRRSACSAPASRSPGRHIRLGRPPSRSRV